MLVLPAGADEMVPPTVDRELLLKKWIEACREGAVRQDLSGQIPGADHMISQEEGQAFVAQKVEEFLRGLAQ